MESKQIEIIEIDSQECSIKIRNRMAYPIKADFTEKTQFIKTRFWNYANEVTPKIAYKVDFEKRVL
jgi:hypothetical protein